MNQPGSNQALRWQARNITPPCLVSGKILIILAVFVSAIKPTRPATARLWLICTILAATITTASAQPTGFLDHLRIGFGAGANTSQIIDLSPFNIFEDLTGAEYENSYSGIVRNIHSHYFVQAEYYDDNYIIAFKPGTYTHSFSKINEVIFAGETVEQETPYLLRYMSVPVEFRYNIDFQRYRPYAGITLAYSHLLQSNDAANQTFIRPKISAGAVIGTYIDLRAIILDFNVGYRTGLHNIADKDNRFGTGGGTAFAQDDILLNDLQVSVSLLFSLQKQRRYSNTECYY